MSPTTQNTDSNDVIDFFSLTCSADNSEARELTFSELQAVSGGGFWSSVKHTAGNVGHAASNVVHAVSNVNDAIGHVDHILEVGAIGVAIWAS